MKPESRAFVTIFAAQSYAGIIDVMSAGSTCIVAVASLLRDGEQPSLRELAQMFAGGRS